LRVRVLWAPLEALSRKGMLTLAVTGALLLVFGIAEAGATPEDLAKAAA
jgi:hypothetical protein